MSIWAGCAHSAGEYRAVSARGGVQQPGAWRPVVHAQEGESRIFVVLGKCAFGRRVPHNPHRRASLLAPGPFPLQASLSTPRRPLHISAGGDLLKMPRRSGFDCDPTRAKPRAALRPPAGESSPAHLYLPIVGTLLRTHPNLNLTGDLTEGRSESSGRDITPTPAYSRRTPTQIESANHGTDQIRMPGCVLPAFRAFPPSSVRGRTGEEGSSARRAGGQSQRRSEVCVTVCVNAAVGGVRSRLKGRARQGAADEAIVDVQ
ncbi:hypothetical protein DFH06DRAFT_1216592 [Mycena polygramma]|nr:hypothetical protein DFH06DRAFT_1216592 [Mycena polygramma]